MRIADRLNKSLGEVESWPFDEIVHWAAYLQIVWKEEAGSCRF